MCVVGMSSFGWASFNNTNFHCLSYQACACCSFTLMPWGCCGLPKCCVSFTGTSVRACAHSRNEDVEVATSEWRAPSSELRAFLSQAPHDSRLATQPALPAVNNKPRVPKTAWRSVLDPVWCYRHPQRPQLTATQMSEPTHRSQRATSAAGRVNVRSLHTSQHFLRAVRIYNVPTRVGTTTHCRKCHLQMVQLLQQLRVTELLCALWSVGQCLTD